MELHEIISVGETDEAGVYLAKADITDIAGERYTCDYVVRPDDNFGLAPVIRAAIDQWVADEKPVQPYDPPSSVPGPRSTAMWRARAIAKTTPHGDGTLFDAIVSAIAGMTDPFVQAAASEAWERGTTFDLDGQLVPVLMDALGMTEEDVLPLIAAAENLPA